MSSKLPMTGVLLCGGKSSRMGYIPKETLRLGGQTFRDRILRQLSVFEQVALSDNKPCSDYPVWRDIYPGCGPLSGIHSALIHADHNCVFVTACDMPNLTEACIRRLVSALDEMDDCLVPVVSGKVHPACAIYRKRILPIVEEQLRCGNYRLLSLLQRVSTCYFTVPAAFESDFTNVNTPESLAQLQP